MKNIKMSLICIKILKIYTNIELFDTSTLKIIISTTYIYVLSKK